MASCRINYSSNLTGHVHHRADHWRPWRYWITQLQALRGVFMGTNFLSCSDVFSCYLQLFWWGRGINWDFLFSFFNWSWTVTKNWFCWWKARAGRGFCDGRGGIPKSAVKAFSRIWFLNTAGQWSQDVGMPGNILFHSRRVLSEFHNYSIVSKNLTFCHSLLLKVELILLKLNLFHSRVYQNLRIVTWRQLNWND